MRGALCAALLAEGALLLAASRFGDFALSGYSAKFVSLIILAGACFLLAVRFFARVEHRGSDERHGGVLVFWIAAVALRLAMLGCAPGDDMWRFVWEGRVQLAGKNPYVLSPAATELAALRDEDWTRINHPESPTIYPPAAQLAFSAIAAISATPLAFKLVFVAGDLLTALLLVRLCNSHRVAAWYAWNPAVIYAFAGAGHYDSLMLLAVTAALWALERWEADPSATGLAAASASLLGVAIALKIVPVFLLPAWAIALRRRPGVLVFAAAIPAGSLLLYGGPHVVLKPLAAFAEVTRFNDLIWWGVEAITIPNPYGRNWPFTLAMAVAAAVVIFRLRHDWRRCALWLMGVALLLSPVLHPWYVTWILPLAVWRRARVWTVLSLSALAALLLWESSRWWTAWQPNLLTRAFVIIPPLLAWGVQAMRAPPRISNP